MHSAIGVELSDTGGNGGISDINDSFEGCVIIEEGIIFCTSLSSQRKNDSWFRSSCSEKELITIRDAGKELCYGISNDTRFDHQ